MSIAYNTSIVRDGLVLHLDAANVKSYPGSGTTWYDLIQKIPFTINGNPTHDGTSFLLDGDTDYMYSTGFPDISISSHTYLVFCKPTSITRRHYVLDARYNEPGNNASNSGMGFDADNTLFNFLHTPSGVDETGGPGGYVANVPYCIGIRRQPNANSIEILSADSTSWISPSLNSNTAGTENVNLNGVIIGNYASPSNSYTFVGNIYSVLMYNRYISDSEYSQNLEALRGRYGI